MLRAENSMEHQMTIFGPVFLYERAGFCTKNSKYFCHNDWPSIYNCARVSYFYFAMLYYRGLELHLEICNRYGHPWVKFTTWLCLKCDSSSSVSTFSKFTSKLCYKLHQKLNQKFQLPNRRTSNRWTLQLDLEITTGGLERVVSAHKST